jgi:hypothetical protein
MNSQEPKVPKPKELDALRKRVKQRKLKDEDYELISKLATAMKRLKEVDEDKEISPEELLQLLFRGDTGERD